MMKNQLWYSGVTRMTFFVLLVLKILVYKLLTPQFISVFGNFVLKIIIKSNIF